MSPDDLATVDRSWADLRCRQGALIEHLAASFGTFGPPDMAIVRARWLVGAVAELVGALATPSQLEERARQVAGRWPNHEVAPSYRIDGRAWMHAAHDVSPTWTGGTARAWRQAWLLLSEVLAEESLSPFGPAPEPSPGLSTRSNATGSAARG